MVQNAAEGKEDVRSVNAEQSCSHTELLIVCNSNKLVYLTSRITALSSTKLHCIFHCFITFYNWFTSIFVVLRALTLKVS